MLESSLISLALGAAFGVVNGLPPVPVALAHRATPAWVTAGISNPKEYKCLEQKAARNGSAFEVVNVGEGAPTTLVMIKWNRREFCTVPPNERQAAIELVNQRVVEAAERKAAKAKHDAEQAAAKAQLLRDAADKAAAKKRIAEVDAAEAKANSERAEADAAIAAAHGATIAKLEADRRIAAANATIEQANAAKAAAQAVKDKVGAAENAAADRTAAAEKAFLPVVEPTSAPVFHKPPECDWDEQAMEPGLTSLMRSQNEACARGQCRDDIQGQLYAYYDQHISRACKAAKAAHLAAWTKWYDNATPEEREQQKKNTGGSCGWDWPIGCAHGF